jgi:8-oxo-dGTP pyrophosphatase MutT (NUDIX family)
VGVVTRDHPRGTLYLIVRARRAVHEWVLPKGHIEADERPEQAAVREVREEAGVQAGIVAPIGASIFGTARVVWFLMQFVAEVEPEERRETFWGIIDEVLERLAFEESRHIVRAAAAARGGGA